MQGLKPEIFSSVISDIYDCALHPEGWNAVMTRVSNLMNAAYATISLADLPHINPVMATHSPWDPEMLRILNEDYGVDGVPGLRDVILGELDHSRSTLNQMSEEEFQLSRFYQDWVKPQGLRDACVNKFAQSGNRLGVVGVITYADRDIVNAEERQFMQLISPHLRRAAMIGDLLNQERLSAHLYKETLSSLQTPVFLTDKTGKLLFANSKAEGLFQKGQWLKFNSGHITATEPLAAISLSDAIMRAAKGESELGNRGVGIPLSSPQEEAAVAYVLPLSLGTLRNSYENAAVAIFIASGESATLPPQSLLITLFQLTQMEARVMLSMRQGKTRYEAAEKLGMSENTIKTHLSRVFDKTGTKSHAELVKLIDSIVRT